MILVVDKHSFLSSFTISDPLLDPPRPDLKPSLQPTTIPHLRADSLEVRKYMSRALSHCPFPVLFFPISSKTFNFCGRCQLPEE